MTKIPAPDIPIPVHLRKNKVPSTTNIHISRKIDMFIFIFNYFLFDTILESDGEDDGENNVKKPETVNFVVMLKKNNKPQVNFQSYSPRFFIF